MYCNWKSAKFWRELLKKKNTKESLEAVAEIDKQLALYDAGLTYCK